MASSSIYNLLTLYNRCLMCVSISICVLNQVIMFTYAHIYLVTIMLQVMLA